MVYDVNHQEYNGFKLLVGIGMIGSVLMVSVA